MHPRLSINTLCFDPAPLGVQVAAVRRIGCSAISPTLEEVTDYGPAEAARLLRDAGITVATLTHRQFGFATPDLAAAERARLDDTIAVAATIGARSITFTTGGRGTMAWPDAAERFAAALAPCVERARAAGVMLSLEPTSHLYHDVSIVHRLADLVALCRQAGVGVGIDWFCCWVDADIERAIADAGAAIALVQASDHVPGDRALPCRAPLGDGAVPVSALVAAIERAGYRGYYDLEIIGPRLSAAGVDAGLTRSARHLGAMLAAG